MNSSVLVLHGFTANRDTIGPFLARLQAAGIPYEAPLLRGHGTHPEDLAGVVWEDWLEDATIALNHLTAGGRPAYIVGHSMGGLLALDLAATRPRQVAGVASVATCLRFSNPLVYLHPLVWLFYPYWDNTVPTYVDTSQAASHPNYRRFPVATFAQLYRYSHRVRDLLPQVDCPLLILQSTRDETVQRAVPARIYREVGSLDKTVEWFHQSSHEMLRDAERDAVANRIITFIRSQAEVSNGSRV